MPRKRPRDDDDFGDVEEYDEDGRQRRRREVEGSGMPLWVFGGIGVGAVLVIAVIVFLVRSGHAERQRLAAEQAAQAERERLIADLGDRDAHARTPVPNRQDAQSQNWPKVIGKWRRTPAPKEEGGYPYYFEFRPDRGVTTTRVNFDGQPQSQEATAEVVIDSGETLSLRLHVHMGMYGYSFQLKPDGTLVLDDGKGGLVFTRVK